MARADSITFTLKAGDLAEDDVAVLRLDGREGLSEPYGFDVVFSTTGGEPRDMQALIGTEATVTFATGGEPSRWLHGEVVKAGLVEVVAARPHYRIRIEPRLCRLARTARSRVFQQRSLPEVVKAVLDEHSVQARLDLQGSYPKREYVVQFRESDLAFVSRLLEHEGLWYRFEHTDSSHELVIGDGVHAYAEGPALPYRPGSSTERREDFLAELARVKAVVTTKAERRDFDFERPQRAVTVKKGDGELEVYEYPGGYTASGDGNRLVAARLEDLKFGDETFEGSMRAPPALPGCKVTVEEHPDGALNRTLLVVRTVHHGLQALGAGGSAAMAASLHTRFTALDAERVYRPRRSTRRPVMPGIQTAKVVGPAGEEIHTDAHGRIKVQFPWDREGANDDQSSCFVRVAQAWAGSGMGHNFIPRIGQEVVVRFLEGDPDRPLITGAVYDGANAPPVSLPGDKTRSALRTNSSPGGGGFNELTFEDSAGKEEVLVHGQKDETITVLNDKAQTVRLNEALSVGGNRRQSVGGNQTLRVSLDDVRSVSTLQTLSVQGARSTNVASIDAVTVGAAQAINVLRAQSITVAMAAAESVGGAAALNVGGTYLTNVGASITHSVSKNKATNVGGSLIEVVGLVRDETVENKRVGHVRGDYDIKVGAGVSVDVGKDDKAEIKGGMEMEVKEEVAFTLKKGNLEADKLTILVGGKPALTMKKSGAVALLGNAITLDGSGAMTLKAPKVKKITPAPAPPAPPTVQQLGKAEEGKKTVRVSFTGTDGKPALAGLKFKLKLPDGSTKEGGISASGEVAFNEVPPGKAELELVDVDKPPEPKKKS